MLTDEICAMASELLAGNSVSPSVLRAFCASAEAEWTAKLKKGLTPADCGKSLLLAAALTAAARCASVGDVGTLNGIRSFGAADLKIERADGEALRQSLQTQAERIMAPFCENGFSFLGVRG